MQSLNKISILTIFLLVLSGCGESNGSGSSDGTRPQLNSMELGSAGGVLELSDPDSPLYGARVVVEDGAIGQGIVKIEIDYEDELPGDLSDSALAVDYIVLGKTIVLTKDVEGTFERPVEVSVPYNSLALEEGDVPSVLFWNPIINTYESVAVTAYDPVAGIVSFRTAHFSKFIIVAIRGLAKTFDTTETYFKGFDVGYLPSSDGFFLRNISSYSAPEGNCLGMAAYSQWFFENAKGTQASASLYDFYRDGDASKTVDDFRAKELVVRAHAATQQINANWQILTQTGKYLVGFDVGVSLIQLMKLTGQPQLFFWKSDIGQHAMVVYSWDPATSSFGLYDPNAPGTNTITVSFDKGGFGQVNNASGHPPHTFAYDANGSIYSPSDMQALFDGAEQGWDEGKYGKISLTMPLLDDGIAFLDSDRNFVLSGEFTRSTGGNARGKPDTIDILVAGALHGSTNLIDDKFTYNVDQIPNPDNTDIVLIAYKSGTLNGGRSIYGSLKQFQVKVGTPASDNIGFERGSFENWISERHTIRSNGSVIPSDKSEVSIGGFDPIAESIRTVLFGDYSVRVNNSDDGYHVSTISRDIVVPENAKTFRLSFSWAAVLEDPQHTPEDQPYVVVRVVNETQDTELYSRRFYSNDPGYPNWMSFDQGGWKAIDWQAVLLEDLSQYAGDTISIYVEAADCGRGAHGGYVYFDAEE